MSVCRQEAVLPGGISARISTKIFNGEPFVLLQRPIERRPATVQLQGAFPRVPARDLRQGLIERGQPMRVLASQRDAANMQVEAVSSCSTAQTARRPPASLIRPTTCAAARDGNHARI
jgi:hypothetical protein